MKIMWLCNIILPRIAKNQGLPVIPTGGWLVGLSEELLKKDDVQLFVCFPYEKRVEGSEENCCFKSFIDKDDKAVFFDEILLSFNPDIIHIFGTEYEYSLDLVKVCEKRDLIDKTVVNIQGLVYAYAYKYTTGLPHSVVHSNTLRSLFLHDNIYNGKKDFERKGECEIRILKSIKHVIGRTDWDYACTKRINPALEYHFCNEILRNQFYEKSGDWCIDRCDRYSIFVSQSGYPIKGFHYMLYALKDIVESYPGTVVYTTGRDPLKCSYKEKLKLKPYEVFIGKTIKELHLENNVVYLGYLNEKEMCRRFLKSHVFVSCSLIENESNSISEAKMLGVPVVSSYVGGVVDRLLNGKSGFFYPMDEYYMLAHYVTTIFSDDRIATNLSKAARDEAMITNDKNANTNQILEIYKNILSDEKA